MAFHAYDKKTLKKFDSETQKSMAPLVQHFRNVEISELSTSEWCVRIVVDDHEAESLRLAAIGRTVKAAAERLRCMIQYRIDRATIDTS